MPSPAPITIHHLHISQSERIVWLAEELELEYTLQLHTRDPVFSPPALVALTPQGSAPILTTTTAATGRPLQLGESNAIAEYLLNREGAYNASGRLTLTPTHDDYGAYLFWLHFANGSLQPALARQ